MPEETMIIQSDRMRLVAKALNSKSRLIILKLLSEKDMDITRIAESLDMSQECAGEHAKILEKAELIAFNYVKGMRGTRKVCSANIKQVVFDLW